MAPDAAIFFDEDAVVQRPGGQLAVHRGAADRLQPGSRAGLIADPPRRGGELRATLELSGLWEWLEPALVVETGVHWRLPDPRAFAVAAALAGLAPGECLFVSDDPALRAAAETAGMRTEVLSEDAPGLTRDERRPPPEKPVFVLAGRVVTLDDDDRVVEDGRIVVSGEDIVGVFAPGEDLGEHADAPVIETGGTIYPGLIDLHNHFVYNVAPLWVVPERFANRGIWRGRGEYRSNVSMPIKLLADVSSTAQAIVRFVEAKALIGGTTTGQGIRTAVEGGISLFDGAMRNVEQTEDPVRLPEAGTLLGDLWQNDPEKVASFRMALATRVAYLYHLSEGVDEVTRERFNDLVHHDLLAPALVGIHSLALQAEDVAALAAAGAKAVWSPFSNLLLYGQTVPLQVWLDAGLPFSIGCDWTPTGSKNLLQELKIARWEADRQEADLDDAALVGAVTRGAAGVVGWQDSVGSLAAGKLADLVVLPGATGDPYRKLIRSRETEISLVMVGGTARFGRRRLMEQLVRGDEIETYRGGDLGLFLQAPDAKLNGLTFEQAVRTLTDAMSDLHEFRRRRDEAPRLTWDAPPQFAVVLDNEFGPEVTDPLLAADTPEMARSIELDAPEVGAGDYWERIEAQHNLPPRLGQALRDAYD